MIQSNLKMISNSHLKNVTGKVTGTQENSSMNKQKKINKPRNRHSYCLGMQSQERCASLINDHFSVQPDEQLNRLKEQVEFRNRFFRMVIHDLRGPTSSIKMGSGMALDSVK